MPYQHSARRTHHHFKYFCFIFTCLLLFVPGCGGTTPAEPAGLSLRTGSLLYGPLDAFLDDSIRVSVFGADEDGVSQNMPVTRVRLAFEIVEAPEQAESAEFDHDEALTDASGTGSARFRVGTVPGLYRLRISAPEYPDLQPVNVTVLGGVTIGGLDQDGRVGRALERPLTVRLEKAPGDYVGAGEGVVRFTLMNAPEGTSLSANVRRTDEDGTAATEIKLGGTQGRVDVAINILSGLNGSNTSVLAPIETHFFAIDYFSVTVSILGGLALFLFGMKMLSESLQFVAGDRLRGMLNLLTTNRFMAVGAGAMITALIQSSSACTVMVVGFVNAGLMKLEQAIGVIMGANIGTTITAQIIALKLSALAMPAIAIGVAILLVAKRQVVKYQASILIGFGILFLGLNLMSAELGQLKNSETVVSLFRGLNAVPGASGYVPLYPFMKAVLYGLIVTLILQSSSATIGLLITVAAAGLIDPFAAFGILLGDNIGTTITAFLASIGTSTTAKRAAAFHLMFNVCGCLLMIGLNFIQWPGMHGRPIFMELANRITPGDVFVGAENLPRFIANAHTLFNLTCTALFISFVPQFARLCRWLVKPSGEEMEVNDARRILEPHLLATPSLALQQVWTEVGIMLEKAREAQNEGYQALIAEPDSDWSSKAREAKNLEKETDELKAAITKYLGGISLTTLNENQSEMFPHLVRTVNDAERVADLGKHLSKLAKRVNKRSLSLTPEAIDDMNAMMALVNELLELAEKTVNINADGIEMSGGGAVLRGKLLDDGYRLAKQAKTKASTLRKNHEARHEQGLCDIKSGVVFLDVANSLARSAGCAINIIEAACHTATPPPGKSPPSRRMTVRNTRVGL